MECEPCVKWLLMAYWMLIGFVSFTCVCEFNLHLLVWVLTQEVLCELCVSHTYVLRLIVRCSPGVGTWKWGTRKLFARFPKSNENFNSVGNSEANTQVLIENMLCLYLCPCIFCVCTMYCVCAFCLCLCLWLLLCLSVHVSVHFVRVRFRTASNYTFCCVCVCVRAFFLCL